MNRQKSTEPNYEELGKHIATIYETGYISLKKSLKISFLKGVATGIGGVVGATLVITLLLWVLSLFQQIPFIGPISESIRTTIEQSK